LIGALLVGLINIEQAPEGAVEHHRDAGLPTAEPRKHLSLQALATLAERLRIIGKV
jgi:hypothetical protein